MKTEFYVPSKQDVTLVVLENDKVQVFPLQEKPEWKIGRYDPYRGISPDIAMHSMLVSREHGTLRYFDNQWYYTDNCRNLNGTFYNGTKMQRREQSSVLLKDKDILRVDNEDLEDANENGVLFLFTTHKVKGDWTVLPLTKSPLVIGRSRDCGLVESASYISSRHAVITWENGAYYLSDCSSTCGTFLNGEAVTRKCRLSVRDCISICDRNYFFLGNRILYARRNYRQEYQTMMETPPEEREVILTANIHSKVVRDNRGGAVWKKKELLHDIRTSIREGTLVAVLGTAGAGKSTLLGCLNGTDQRGMDGTVCYRGVDLVKHLDQIKFLIGNVPQKKVIPMHLTPEQTFSEEAELRMPRGTTQSEIQERVEKTLEMLHMKAVRSNLNANLSGGEQTRVNLGIDLVADRDLYFLDEPEQGLSPNLRDDLYKILQELAHQYGKTIVAVIHDVSSIDMFDQVVFLVKKDNVGRLGFSGTPEEARRRFGVSSFSEVYKLLEENPARYIGENESWN